MAALHVACRKNRKEVVALLLQHKVPVDLAPRVGNGLLDQSRFKRFAHSSRCYLLGDPAIPNA